MKKFIIKIGIISLVSMAVLMACHDDEISGPSVKIETINSGVEVVTNSSVLANRIELVNEPMNIVMSSSAPAKAPTDGQTVVNGHEWTYLAEVLPLQNYSVSYIVSIDNYVYVTYHIQGDVHGGILEVLDVSDPENPLSKSYISFNNIDINHLTVDPESNKVWLAGSSFVNGAVVIEIEVVNGIIYNSYTEVILNDIFQAGIPASANSTCYVGDNKKDDGKFLYVTCGNTIGGLVKLNAETLAYVDHMEFSSAKSVVIDRKDKVYKVVTFAAANTSQIRVHDRATLDVTKSITLSFSLSHQNVVSSFSGKNAMAMYKDHMVYVPLGSYGVKAYDVDAESLEHESVTSMIVHGNSNGVDIQDHDKYVFMANGADGLAVAHVPDNSGDPIIPVFTWDTEEMPASANFVASYYDGGGKILVFLAKGLGGIKIIRVKEL